jgi:hypothetical protein
VDRLVSPGLQDVIDMGHHDSRNAGNVSVGRICLALTLATWACDADDPETLHEWREGTVALERPTGGGGFINNGLHDPEVGGFDPDYALETNWGLKGSKLLDADRLATAHYVVECALPEGESVVKSVGGTLVELEGALGLAPEWQDSACDQDCQEWVSACLLARTNVSDEAVALWLTADHPELGVATSPSFSHYEASFFGNLFAGSGQAYVCPAGQGAGAVLAQLQGRTCSTEAGGWCGFTSYSNCHSSTRCEVMGTNSSPTLVDCRAGTTPSGSPLRTISSYVGTP